MSEPDEPQERHIPSAYGLLAAIGNSGQLVERLDALINTFLDDSPEPEVRDAANGELVEKLADLHALAIDVWQSLQQIQDDQLKDPPT